MSSPLQLPNGLNVSSIKNLIFDLGNVLVKLNQNASAAAEFERLGATNPEARLDNVDLFQTGKLDAQAFRAAVRLSTGLPSSVTDAQFDKAWSAILANFPRGRLELVQKLRRDSGYKVYVLSNSDTILTERLDKIIDKHHNERSLDPFFDKVFYSHEIGHLKPHKPAFMYVIDDLRLVPGETLLMDDSAENINAATSCGLQAVQIDITTNLNLLSRAPED
ncbi:hypothetical protein BGZ74_003117 [Mortierella antarctica]|nr:hypothetical protein BGZ74_003117 [Mortierella antarctica]KAG0343085.1 hypothetical protein BG005_002566 [Podila minutissima]